MKLKEKILDLRKQGYSYNKISEKLKCSKGTISFHCTNYNLNSPIIRQLSKEEINEKIKKTRKTYLKNYYNKLQQEPFDSLSFERMRKRIIFEQNNECFICKNNNWLGKPIAIEIDHIDGDSNNNNRNNLRGLCPNCHSQTSTWRGRNARTNRLKVNDEEILTALINNNYNIRKALLECNLTAKGGNYKRVYKIIDDILK